MNETLKIVLVTLISILVLFILVSCILGITLTKLVFEPKIFSRADKKQVNVDNGFLNGLESLERKETEFVMKDGYIIHGDISIRNPKKFVIMSHGHTSNREGMMKFARTLLFSDYSYVFIDLRGHGDNAKHYVSLGYNESKDINEIVNQLKEMFGENIEVGLFGHSFGSATSLMTLKYRQDLKFVIADSPYASLDDLFIFTLHSRHLPAYLPLFFAHIFCKSKYKFSFREISPKDIMKNNNVPVLLLHGNKDKIVEFTNQKLIANNLKCYFEAYSFEGSDHGKAVSEHEEKYFKVVKDFINKVESNTI